ncbi:MAG: UDP-N-acetylmuramoyl-L-alanine--D-glutamate ligase [Thainema sp.]
MSKAQNAHVIGLGRSGVAAARLLKREGWEVVLSDRNANAKLAKPQQQLLNQANIPVRLGHGYDPATDAAELVVVSPGVPWDIPALVEAREQGIQTIGEMELAWQHLQNCPWVGITGTNGKTTTTELTAAIFQSAGLNAPACGNIGHAACELALADQKLDWVIAEISSYQIESSSTLSPRIGIWTTFTPDHLARHYTLDNYYDIKAKLLRQSELQILNGDDPYLRQTADRWPNAHWTSVKGKNAIAPLEPSAYIENGWVYVNGEAIVESASLRMVGSHNAQNLLMAALAARLAGIGKEVIASAIAQFPGVPHRLEHICTWHGIDFVNDSKATNYDAAEVGLNAFEQPVILIAGGEAKEGDDQGWLTAIRQKAKAVLLIGKAAPDFSERLAQVEYSDYEIVETLERAVLRAAKIAEHFQINVVLFSPACASFDQYRSFEERGDHFRQICQTRLK